MVFYSIFIISCISVNHSAAISMIEDVEIEDISFSQIGEEFAEQEVDERTVETIQLTTFYSEEEDA